MSLLIKQRLTQLVQVCQGLCLNEIMKYAFEYYEYLWINNLCLSSNKIRNCRLGSHFQISNPVLPQIVYKTVMILTETEKGLTWHYTDLRLRSIWILVSMVIKLERIINTQKWWQRTIHSWMAWIARLKQSDPMKPV